MATGPQPPHPPAPPQPVGSHSHLVAIALLFLALVVLIAGVAVWGGLHFLSRAVHIQVDHGGGKKQEVSIKTPLGSLEVNHELSGAGLGLPIYPGSTRLKDNDSATVNINIADATKIRVLAGKFETPDPVQKVAAFYHDRLGDQVTKFKERDEEGKTVFEIKHGKLDKVVALKNDRGMTIIELVHVSEGAAESN